MGLARTCLAVGADTGVEALKRVFHGLNAQTVKDVLLGLVVAMETVKAPKRGVVNKLFKLLLKKKRRKGLVN